MILEIGDFLPSPEIGDLGFWWRRFNHQYRGLTVLLVIHCICIVQCELVVMCTKTKYTAGCIVFAVTFVILGNFD